MVIANYSPQHGQTGATSNMLAILLLMVLKYDQNVFVLQSHFKMNNLEGALVKKLSQPAMDSLDEYGMDSLIRNRNVANLDKKLIDYSCHSFLDGRLQLLPGTTMISEEIYRQESSILLDVLKAARSCYDQVFIDVTSSDSELTNQILQEADLVLVNLCQNTQVLDNFFLGEKTALPNKIFLFGNYDKRSRYNLTNLRFEYRELDKKRTFPIEYCTGYRDAMWDAEIISFFRRNLDLKKSHKNYAFIQSIERAAKEILKYQKGGR